MQRVLEPELMDDAEQAEAYAVADFAEVNQAFVDRFAKLFPNYAGTKMIDLGCGPADIPARMCQKYSKLQVTAVDGAPSMLEEARRALAAQRLLERISLVVAYLPKGLPEGPFDAIISNSLLHHLPEPQVIWEAVKNSGQKDAPILVTDLLRPKSKEKAREIVETYAGNEREGLKEDFYHSLCAAFRIDEVKEQLTHAGLQHLTVEAISDRHLAVFGRL